VPLTDTCSNFTWTAVGTRKYYLNQISNPTVRNITIKVIGLENLYKKDDKYVSKGNVLFNLQYILISIDCCSNQLSSYHNRDCKITVKITVIGDFQGCLRVGNQRQENGVQEQSTCILQSHAQVTCALCSCIHKCQSQTDFFCSAYLLVLQVMCKSCALCCCIHKSMS